MRGVVSLILAALIPLANAMACWNPGSPTSAAYPYYGIADLIADLAYQQLKAYNDTMAKWITDWYLSPDGYKWGDWGYSYSSGTDNWLGYTDDPVSYWAVKYPSYRYYHWYTVHGDWKYMPYRVAQLFDWVVGNLTEWIREGMPTRSEAEHKAAYAAGLLAHYFADACFFPATDYTAKMDSHPPDDPLNMVYADYYGLAGASDEFLTQLLADLSAYSFRVDRRVDPAAAVAALAAWVNSRDSRTVTFTDSDGSTRTVGLTYYWMMGNFTHNYDSSVSYLGVRGYDSWLYSVTLENIKAALGNFTRVLYTAFAMAEEGAVKPVKPPVQRMPAGVVGGPLGFTASESSQWVGNMAHTTMITWDASRFERTGMAMGSKGWVLMLTDVDWANKTDVRTSLKYYSEGTNVWRISLGDYDWGVGLGLAWRNNYTWLNYYGSLGWSNQTALQQYFKMEGKGSMSHGAITYGLNWTRQTMLYKSYYQGMYRVNATEAFSLTPLYVPWAPNVTAPPGAPSRWAPTVRTRGSG